MPFDVREFIQSFLTDSGAAGRRQTGNFTRLFQAGMHAFESIK